MKNHVFHYGEHHTNKPEGRMGNCRGCPNGIKCLCGKETYQTPIQDNFPYEEGETYKCVKHKNDTHVLKELKHRAEGLLYAIEDALKNVA